MPTSAPAVPEPRAVSTTRACLLYVMGGSLALYPLLEQFVAPVIGVAYALAVLSVVFQLMRNGFSAPRTYLGWVWAIYALVYVAWYGNALLHGNDPTYIRQDSLGFLLYFGAMPILFLFIRFGGLEATFVRFIVHCSIFIAVISVVVVVGYYITFGPIDGDSLIVLNAFIHGLGLTWQIDSNAGVLGVYTYTGHLLLLGIAIVLHRYSLAPNRWDIALVMLFLVGIVLDGHRALVVSSLMQLLIVAPRLFARVSLSKKLVLASVLVIGPAVAVVLGMDWISARFDFSANDPSTAERWAQIPALVDKISREPLFGSGFGSVASYIRSIERPFSYEVDFLATAMKLGLVGCVAYFGTYLGALAYAHFTRGQAGLFLLSAGLPFFFYMGTNGGQAMSTDSAVFHIFIFLLIDFAARPIPRASRHGEAGALSAAR
jgi:hypothetical protein